MRLYGSFATITVMKATMQIPDETYRNGKKPNLSCFGVGRRFVRKNADGPHDMASIRESIAAGRKME